MSETISAKEYTERQREAVPLGQIDLDTYYNLYQRSGRYGEPELTKDMKIEPESCWILHNVRVWIFSSPNLVSIGCTPESYLKDWFLTL